MVVWDVSKTKYTNQIARIQLVGYNFANSDMSNFKDVSSNNGVDLRVHPL